jgi:hypothetical protein
MKTEKEIMWHYVEKKDLGKRKANTACGISIWSSGLSTCNPKWVECKNCLRVIEAKKKKITRRLAKVSKWKALLPDGGFSKISKGLEDLAKKIDKAINGRW